MSASGVSGDKGSAYYQMSDLGDTGNIEVKQGTIKDGKVDVVLTVKYGDSTTRITLRVPINGQTLELDNTKKVVRQAIHVHQSMIAKLKQLAPAAGGTVSADDAKAAHAKLRGEFSKGTLIQVNVSRTFFGRGEKRATLKLGEQESDGGIQWQSLRGEKKVGEKKGAVIVGSRDTSAIAKLAHSIALRELQKANTSGALQSESELPEVDHRWFSAIRSNSDPTVLHSDYKSEAELIATFKPALQQIEQRTGAELQQLQTGINETRAALEKLMERDGAKDAAGDEAGIARLHTQLDKLQNQHTVILESALRAREALFSLVKAKRHQELADSLPHCDKAKKTQISQQFQAAREGVFNAIAECEHLLAIDKPEQRIKLGAKPGLFSKTSATDITELDQARMQYATQTSTRSPQSVASAIAGIVNPNEEAGADFHTRIESDTQSLLAEVSKRSTAVLIDTALLAYLNTATTENKTLEEFAEATIRAAHGNSTTSHSGALTREMEDDKAKLLADLKSLCFKELNKDKGLLSRSVEVTDKTSLNDILKSAIQTHFTASQQKHAGELDDSLAPSTTATINPYQNTLKQAPTTATATATAPQPIDFARTMPIFNKAMELREQTMTVTTYLDTLEQIRTSSPASPHMASIAKLKALADLSAFTELKGALKHHLADTVGVAMSVLRDEDIHLRQPTPKPAAPPTAAPSTPHTLPAGVTAVDLSSLDSSSVSLIDPTLSSIANTINPTTVIPDFNRSGDTALTEPQYTLAAAASHAVCFYRDDITPQTAAFGNFAICPHKVTVQVFSQAPPTTGTLATPADPNRAKDEALLIHDDLAGLFVNGSHAFNMSETAFHVMKIRTLHADGKIDTNTAAGLIKRLIAADTAKVPDKDHPAIDPNTNASIDPQGKEGVWQVVSSMSRISDMTAWDNISTGVMYKLLEAKFTQNPEMASKLVSQADKTFIETVGDRTSSVASSNPTEKWGRAIGGGTAYGDNTLGNILKALSQNPAVISSALSHTKSLAEVSGRADIDQAKALSMLRSVFSLPECKTALAPSARNASNLLGAGLPTLDAVIDALAAGSPLPQKTSAPPASAPPASAPVDLTKDEILSYFDPDAFDAPGPKALAQRLRSAVDQCFA